MKSAPVSDREALTGELVGKLRSNIIIKRLNATITHTSQSGKPTGAAGQATLNFRLQMRR